MKICDNCKYRRKDLECWVDHCDHPDFLKDDKIKGALMMPIRAAIKECDLEKWEKKPTIIDWIQGWFL